MASLPWNTPTGAKEWWVDGDRHRVGGPSIVTRSGDKQWWTDGVLNRLDGPAVERANGTNQWYVESRPIEPPYSVMLDAAHSLKIAIPPDLLLDLSRPYDDKSDDTSTARRTDLLAHAWPTSDARKILAKLFLDPDPWAKKWALAVLASLHRDPLKEKSNITV